MFEWVRWCSSLADLASGNCSKVRLSTRRNSGKRLSGMPFFLAVNGKQLSKMVFLKVFSLIIYMCSKHIEVTEVIVSLKGRLKIRRF